MKLGDSVEDKITGFGGVLTGFAEYLTGCRQWLVTSRTLLEGEPKSIWIDEVRLSIAGTPVEIAAPAGNPGGPRDTPRSQFQRP